MSKLTNMLRQSMYQDDPITLFQEKTKEEMTLRRFKLNNKISRFKNKKILTTQINISELLAFIEKEDNPHKKFEWETAVIICSNAIVTGFPRT